MKAIMQRLRAALSPWLPFFAMAVPALIGAALVVNGVYILAGTGWAFIAGGLGFIAIAAIIRRGVYYVGQ